jgi:hypothetical protein
MELMQLEMFVVVVEEGSVRAASERVRRDHACSNAIPNREHQAVKRGNLLIHADPFALIDFPFCSRYELVNGAEGLICTQLSSKCSATIFFSNSSFHRRQVLFSTLFLR